MTRWGLGPLQRETGVGTAAAANRMADYGIDPWWMSHEPWVVPEPFTPEAGELWSREDIDQWLAALERIVEEAYANPERVTGRAATAAHRGGQGRLDGRSRRLGHDLARLSAQAPLGSGRPENGAPDGAG